MSNKANFHALMLQGLEVYCHKADF